MNNTLDDFDSNQNDFTALNFKANFNDALDKLESKKDLEGLTGVPSGFLNLDIITAGWQQPELVVLATRPGMGKTSFILSILRNAALDFGQPVALFSLEMTSVQLMNRMLSAETEIDLEKIYKGTLAPHEWTQLHRKAQQLSEIPIFIDDTINLKIEELRAKCTQLTKRHGVKVIAIDNIQLMLSTDLKESITEHEELSRLIRTLKKLSSELNVTIIALSQVSRAVETRGGNRKPYLSDLRGSGTIEEQADVVMILYRPECYNIIYDENGNLTVGVAELIIAKNRNSAPNTIQLRFINRYTKFLNFDDYCQSVQAHSFGSDVTGFDSFDASTSGNVFQGKANNLSGFSNANPSQEPPF